MTLRGALGITGRRGFVDTWRRRGPYLVLGLLTAAPAQGYPEFQEHAKRQSGRGVNCALCHAHAEGPDGTKPGQIGRFGPEELQRLNAARAAFQPSAGVDSPILNPFGDHIIQTIGKERFLALRRDPASLAEALGTASDLDDDGIPDAQEYLDGTHPLDAHSGSPWKLFTTNLGRGWWHVLLLLAAVASGMYGVSHLLRWCRWVARATPGQSPES